MQDSKSVKKKKRFKHCFRLYWN